MSLFGGKNRRGGLMDEIRCDEESYLIWKWHPAGVRLGEGARESSIRWGSSLRVKEGEVAVFVYAQSDGTMQDFIEGPRDLLLNTSNLPILASVIGMAYDGGTPFQAEVYFINLANIIQIPFAVPYFDIYDPRFLDFGVPTAVRGKLTFNIADYREFISLHRLINFDLKSFQSQVKDAIVRYVKNIVSNLPSERNMPVVQIERAIDQVNNSVESKIQERFACDFGVNVISVDISAIDVDKTSEGYLQLKSVTQDMASATIQAQTDVNIRNLEDLQRINADNLEKTMQIQREEAQYAQRKQTQMSNFAAYELEQQAAVGIAGAEALGQMGTNGGTEMEGSGGMNPAAMMTGMVMGGAIGQNMAGIMNSMMTGVNNLSQSAERPSRMGTTPPPVPGEGLHIVQNGQPVGPFDLKDLSRMVSTGLFTKDSLVWKQGLSDWIKAGSLQELESLFNVTPPRVPGQ